MLRNDFFRSIQSRLIFAFLTSAFVAIVIVAIFNFWLRQQLIDEADARQIATANSILESLEQFNQRQIEALEMGARLPQFVRFIELSPEERADPLLHEELRQTLSSMQAAQWNQFYTLSFAILDVDGINIFDTTSSNIGRDESEMSYFRQPMVTGVRLISDVLYLSERTGAYYYFLVPIRRDTAPNPVIGLLRAEVSVSAIQDLLLSLAAEDTFSEFDIMLFDSQMVRLVDTRGREEIFRSIEDYSLSEMTLLKEAQLLPNLAPSSLLRPIPSLAQELGQLNGNAVFESPISADSMQEERLAAIRLRDPNWYLVIGKPTEEFYLPIQRQTQGLLLLSFFLLTAGFGISLAISQNLTRPIRRLTEMAKEVAEGNLDIQAPITSKDEIGTLTFTFNQMTRDLKDIRSNLQHLVEERTQSLKESNESLMTAMKERERLEEQNLKMALEAERTRILSEFIQDASHEFKTPLSVINVKIHLLKRMTDAKFHPHLLDIELQSHHIETIVSDMVLMSKLDSKTELSLRSVYVNDFLRSVYDLEHARFARNGISLQLELHAQNSVMDINAEMMHELLKRILDNARKFTPKDATVTIQSDTNPLWVEIRIVDTGVGMSEEVLARAFERFYRVDEAHTTRGFGLGLPIAKRIIELFNGTISISSIPDEGTTVLIRLPLSKNEPKLG